MYKIEGLIDGVWSGEAVGEDDGNNMFITKEEAEKIRIELIDCYGCEENKIRVVEIEEEE